MRTYYVFTINTIIFSTIMFAKFRSITTFITHSSSTIMFAYTFTFAFFAILFLKFMNTHLTTIAFITLRSSTIMNTYLTTLAFYTLIFSTIMFAYTFTFAFFAS